MQLQHFQQFRCGQGQSLSLSVPQYQFLCDQSAWNSQCNKRFAAVWLRKYLSQAAHFCFQVWSQHNIWNLNKKRASEALSVKTSESFQDDKLYPHISVSSCNSFIAVLTYRFFLIFFFLKSCWHYFQHCISLVTYDNHFLWTEAKVYDFFCNNIADCIIANVENIFFTVCCHLLPCTCKGRSWAGDVRLLPHIRQSFQSEYFTFEHIDFSP